jgi:hypothetical protein
MLHEHGLHLRAGMSQLGITVREENDSERCTKDQQTEWLKRIEKFHEVLREERDLSDTCGKYFSRWPFRLVMGVNNVREQRV